VVITSATEGVLMRMVNRLTDGNMVALGRGLR
jgi:hypothetical protein